MAEVLQHHVWVVEKDPLHKLLLQPPPHDLLERAALYRPHASTIAQDADGCSSGFVKQQCPLPKVGTLPEGPHFAAVDVHAQLSRGDNMKGATAFALLHDESILRILLQEKGIDERVRLPVRQMLKDVNLGDGLHLPSIVERCPSAADASYPKVLQRKRHVLCGEHRDAAAFAPRLELPQVRDAEALGVAPLCEQTLEELTDQGAAASRLLLHQLQRWAFDQRRVAEPLPAPQDPAAQTSEPRCHGFAVHEKPELRQLYGLLWRVRAHAHPLHQRQLLRGGEAREDRRVPQAGEQQVALQEARAEVLAKHGPELLVCHAEELDCRECPHRGATRLIVEQGALAKAIPVRQELHRLPAHEHLEPPPLHQVHAPRSLALANDFGANLVHLREEGLAQAVLLLGREPVEECHGVHEGPVLGVVALRIGPHRLPEATAVASPEAHRRAGHDAGVPWAVVEQGEAPKGAAA
mmetsp:Transcript_106143/g.342358  ORF Transcript_106143/g.342358 Transcript_106143/m.342358 type:complete len:466 (-) Transcript_106143:816-2213(-)